MSSKTAWVLPWSISVLTKDINVWDISNVPPLML
jgi:hypothetical protein